MIWKMIEKKGWKARSKYRAALTIFGILSGLLGFAAWLIIRELALSTWDWMLCFIGYPFFISWFIVLIYSGNHAFHDGAQQQIRKTL